MRLTFDILRTALLSLSSVRRVPATIIICVSVFLVGLGSAIDISILLNQDSVWGYALIISGCILVFLVLRYGVLRFREQLFNQVRAHVN